MPLARRSLRGNVDRNGAEVMTLELKERRSLRGNVDRNMTKRMNLRESNKSFPTWERG